MTTNQIEKVGNNTDRVSKTKPKVSEIISDIKNGATANFIIKKHQISFKQMKMLIIHCHKKGILKKADLVENFFPIKAHNNSDNIPSEEQPKKIKKPKHPINSIGEAKTTAKNISESESQENSVDLSDIVQLIKRKIKNEKILLGKFTLSAQNICAICLIIFFFFPWMNIGGLIKFSGYEIPDAVKTLGQFAASFGETTKMNPKVHLFYLLYLIPIFSVITIILNIKGREPKYAGLVAAAVPIVSLIYFVYEIGSEILDGLAIGAYLTLFTAFGMIYATVGDQIINKIRDLKKKNVLGPELSASHAKKESLDVTSG